jgi:TolB-like protein/cytochrome c-type biogenesis protein CcmH/NrfG
MRYRFAEFELDTERMEFRANGEVRAIEPQVFDVLRHLLENVDRLVSRDELIDAVWGGRIVSDATVSARINAVRKAVGDSGERQALIKTVPRRGFRFVIPVFVVDQEQAAESAEARPIVDRPALVPDKPSIAVLPFRYLSGEPGQEYFADGITQDIITSLSKIGEIFVISGSSTLAYKETEPTADRVAEDFGIRYVLEGSVQISGTGVRVSTRLIEAATRRNLWAEHYDRELTDVFALQDEITQEIVTALQVNLTEGQQARLRRRQTSSIAAWEFYVRGLSDVRRFTRENNAEARDKLERAIKVDADFAAAWTLLGWTYMQGARAGWDESPTASFEQAANCVDKSLMLDPLDPEPHALIGWVRLHQRQYDAAIASGKKAIELGPNIAESYVALGQTLNYAGRAEEGTALVEKAMRLSPFYPDNWLGVLANGYRLLGRYEEAIALDQERLRRTPDNFFSDFRLAALNMELGHEELARAQASEALKKNPSLTLKQIRISEPYRDEKYLEHYLDFLRRAGLPEQ